VCSSRDHETLAEWALKKVSSRAQGDEIDSAQEEIPQQEVNLEDGATQGWARSSRHKAGDRPAGGGRVRQKEFLEKRRRDYIRTTETC